MRVGGVTDVKTQSIENQNAYYTLGPLNWMLKIFGLHCSVRNNGHLKCSWSLLQNVLLALTVGCTNFFCLYYKVRYVFPIINLSVKLTDTVQMFYNYFIYITDLYFVYKYGRHICLEYFTQYRSIDNIIGMTYYTVVRGRIIRLIVMFMLIWIISSACDYVAWILSYGWIIPTVFSFTYLFLLFKILTSLDLTSQIMNIEVRLRVIGDLIQDYYVSLDPLPGFKNDIVFNENWLYSDSCSRQLEKEKLKQSQRLYTSPINELSVTINSVNRCYLLLIEQMAFINAMYGVRILLNSLSLLIDIITYTNIGIRLVIGTQPTTYDSGYIPAVSSFARVFSCAAVLVSLVDHCERAYRQSDRIISLIDHVLVNKKPDAELRSCLTELRALIESRPVAFHMANFFRINYSMLASVASVVVTYTIILVQSIN